MTNSVNNNIPYVPENVLDPAAGLNLAINHIDATLQLSVLGIEDSPPSESVDGDRYIVGTGAGAWAGEDDRIARYVEDGNYWQFFDAFYAVNQGDGKFYVKLTGVWSAISVD